jgi:rRNA maturation endonuclease Nob1
MAERGRVAEQLVLCRGCSQFVRQTEETCPFCGGDLAALQAAHDERAAETERAAAALRSVLGEYLED